MKLEIKRQPIHILSGLLIIALLYYDLLSPLILSALVIISVIASILIKKTRPKVIYRLLQFVEREENLEHIPGKGLIAYLAGVLVVVTLFDKDIALASIMILALGDSISRLVGPFGRIRHPFNNAKFIEGVIAGMIAASLGSMLFVKPYEAIAASFFAMLIEGIDLKVSRFKVDDNITIPIISAVVIWAIRYFI